MSESFDYVIVGGGLAGCTLASKLHSLVPASSILLIEAGEDVSQHPLTQEPFACFACHYSELDWAYKTVPQKHLNNREMYAAAGKALSEGSAINYGTWTRGSANDYDQWGKLVGDRSWEYDGWLPYFRETETHYSTDDLENEQHGFNGHLHTMSVTASSKARKYPLRDPLRRAWKEFGVEFVEDGNAGKTVGLSELVESWRDGKRQLASQIFSLQGVKVITGKLVRKVLFGEENAAIGVELANGQQFKASKEVIVSTGAYRTPQVLMLSGIGSEEVLSAQKISVVASIPEVGKNFHDHLAFAQWWKVKHPEQGISFGTPKWADPGYMKGLPSDWLVSEHAPTDLMRSALKSDNDTKHDALLVPEAAHTETLITYAPANAQLCGVEVPMDGTHLASLVIGLTPTSTGSITIASNDPATAPVIDPNYYATEADRVSLRSAARQVMRVLLESKDGKEIVESETTPEGFAPLTASSSDADIDVRVARTGGTIYHAGGSCAMGKVVDTNLKVKKTKNLRIVDASVLPLPISAHYQACIYALALRAAYIIAKDNR